MVEKKNNKKFFERWSDKKSGLEKDVSSNDKKVRKKRKNQILESNQDIDKKYEKMTDKEILHKLDLPDPSKVKKEEELNVFFKSSIPERLKRIAMRRLWRLNPIIRFADAEINDYAEDFTDAATVIDDLQTSYVVGQGHFNPDIDKVLGENEHDADTEKNKTSTKIKKTITTKSDQKIKTKKKENPKENKKNIKDKKHTSLSSGNVSRDAEQEKEPKEQDKNLVSAEVVNKHLKIKPKNLTFKRK